MSFNAGVDAIPGALLTRFHKMSFGTSKRADGCTINDVMWTEEAFKSIRDMIGEDGFKYQVVCNINSLYHIAMYIGLVEPPSLDVAYFQIPHMMDVLQVFFLSISKLLKCAQSCPLEIIQHLSVCVQNSGTKVNRSREINRTRSAMITESLTDAINCLYGMRVTEGSAFRPPGIFRYEDVFLIEAMAVVSESTVHRCFDLWSISQLETPLLDHIMGIVCDVFAEGRRELWDDQDENLFVSRPEHHQVIFFLSISIPLSLSLPFAPVFRGSYSVYFWDSSTGTTKIQTTFLSRFPKRNPRRKPCYWICFPKHRVMV